MPVDKKPLPHVGHFGHKLLVTLAGILLAYLIVFFGTLIRNNLAAHNTVGFAPKQERMITVDVEEKVRVEPNLAVLTMGVASQEKTVSLAQEKNTASMNMLYTRLAQLGIAEADIKTSQYSVQPQYNYEVQPATIVGYQVTQQATVSVRDLKKADLVLALAGELNLNLVSGLEFVIDEREAYLAQARAAATKKALHKAAKIAASFGARPVDVVNYHEYEVGVDGGPRYDAYAYEIKNAGSAPSIAPGTNEIILHVTMTVSLQ